LNTDLIYSSSSFPLQRKH